MKFGAREAGNDNERAIQKMNYDHANGGVMMLLLLSDADDEHKIS